MRGRNRHHRGNRPEQHENNPGTWYRGPYGNQYDDREERWGSRDAGQERYRGRQGSGREEYGRRDWDEGRSWRGRDDQPAEENLGWPSEGPAQYERQGRHQGRERDVWGQGNFGNRESRRYQDPYGSDTENYGGAGYAERSDYERMGEGGQHRGKGPKGYQRSDERIREDVSEALSQDGDIDASEVEVSVRGGQVTLSGTVDSRRAKRAAEDAAEDCPGVKDVQNNIRVQAQERGRGQDGLGNMSQDYSGARGSSSREEGDSESRARTRSPVTSAS